MVVDLIWGLLFLIAVRQELGSLATVSPALDSSYCAAVFLVFGRRVRVHSRRGRRHTGGETHATTWADSFTLLTHRTVVLRVRHLQFSSREELYLSPKKWL